MSAGGSEPGQERTDGGGGTLLRVSLVYAAGNGLNAAGIFLMIPILTRYLSPEGYGVVTMFALLASFTVPFVGLNIHGALARRYYDLPKAEFAAFAGNCVIILVVSAAGTLSLLWFLRDYLGAAMGLPYVWQFGAVMFCVGQYIGTLLLTRWQVLEKPLHYGGYLLGQTCLSISLSLLFVVILGRDWQGRLEGQVAAVTAFGVVGLCWMAYRSHFTFRIRREYIASALRFGVPLVPHAISAVLLVLADRAIIASVVGLAEAGRYAVAFQFASVLNVLTAAMNSAFVPWLFRRLSLNSAHVRLGIVRLTYWYAFGLVSVACTAYLGITELLPLLVGREYLGIEGLIGWLLIAAVCNGMYLMTANYVFFSGSTHLLSVVTVAVVAVHLPLTYVFTTEFGAVGAAQAGCISLGLLFVLTWWLGAKLVPMPWSLRAEVPAEHHSLAGLK